MISLAIGITIKNKFENIGLIIGPNTIEDSTGDNLDKIESLTLGINFTANDSKNFQIRALAVDAEDGSLYCFSEITNKHYVGPELQEYDKDENFKQLFEFKVKKNIEAIQIQVKARTVGNVPGIVENIKYELG